MHEGVKEIKKDIDAGHFEWKKVNTEKVKDIEKK